MGGGALGPSNKSKQKVALLESRQDETRYPEHWKTDLPKAPCAAPCYCMFATMCCYCASFQLRKRALHGDMTRYICCNGACPCSGKMKEQECPQFCLAMEVWYCFAQSVASTRYMLQDEFRIKNTKCDNCIIGTMIFLQYLSCICNIVACLTQSEAIDQAAECTDNIADVVWCTVCGCMQTQAKVQLDLRDAGGNPHERPPMQAPVQQHMAIHNAPHNPAPYGAPMQQPYAGAPPGYPQGPPQGYPQQPGAYQSSQYPPPPPGAYPGQNAAPGRY